PQSQVRWRAEDLDGVPRRGMTECGRIDRAGVGQAALGGGLTDLGREVFEAGRCRQLQGSQRLLATHDEGMRQPDRQYDEVARSGGEDLAVAVELGRAGQDVEALIFFGVPVQGRCESGWVDELGDGELAAG